MRSGLHSRREVTLMCWCVTERPSNRSRPVSRGESSTETVPDRLKADTLPSSLLSATSGPSSADDQRSSSLNDQSLRSEVEALQAKLQDVEKKSQREIKALNQEVNDEQQATVRIH